MGSGVLRAFGGRPRETSTRWRARSSSRAGSRTTSRRASSTRSIRPRWGPNPVQEFLTRRKSGHCETFATAMALVLREHGIPSRLVTGFAGGERGPFGSYYLVRGLDAHAWVEAWCGPAQRVGRLRPRRPRTAGRGSRRVNLLRSAGQMFENLEFLYGRYVLGFAQADQGATAQTVREGMEAVSADGEERRLGRSAAFAGSSRPGDRLPALSSAWRPRRRPSSSFAG